MVTGGERETTDSTSNHVIATSCQSGYLKRVEEAVMIANARTYSRKYDTPMAYFHLFPAP